MTISGVTHGGTGWSNADTDRIELVAADPSWPAQFEAEARALTAVVPALSELRIEHFGSTSVAGLRAKPIIDILILHPVRDLWPSLVDPLNSIGYIFWAQNPRRDRMFFVKGMPPFGLRRTHHLHVRVPSDARDEIRFRDALRADPAIRRMYEELKDALATRHPNDRDAYTEGKTAFVSNVLEGCGGRDAVSPDHR